MAASYDCATPLFTLVLGIRDNHGRGVAILVLAGVVLLLLRPP